MFQNSIKKANFPLKIKGSKFALNVSTKNSNKALRILKRFTNTKNT